MAAGGIAMSAVGFPAGRFRRPEWVSLVIALACGGAVVIAALLAPFYQSVSTSSSGTVTHSSATLVGVNGWGVLLVTCAPLAAAVMTAGALWRRAGRPGAGVTAWTVTGLLACVNAVALLSIGVFILPITAALVVACGTHGRARPN
jgi:hypothetical protein